MVPRPISHSIDVITYFQIETSGAILEHLSKKFFHDFSAFWTGEVVVAAGVMVSELVVGEAQKMKDGGVEVAEVDFAFDSAKDRVVGSSSLASRRK